MKIKEFLLKPKTLWHLGAIVLFITVSCVFFFPALKGYSVNAHDVRTWVGMSQEVKDYRESADQQILWTNSMFSGMPSTQISMIYEGSQVTRLTRDAFSLWLPQPVSFLFAYFLAFYILACTLKIKPLFGALGALAYGFSTYFIVIIQAGHNTKAIALGYAPLLLAGFILAYRGKRWLLGVALSALFMSIEIASNHLQITYYFGFILIALGIVELVRHYEKQLIVRFAKITGAMVLAYGLAILMNIGNITGTAEYAPHTIRGGSDLAEFQEPDTTENAPTQMIDNGALSIDYITHWSYGKGETFTLLVPNFKGGKSSAIGANKDNKKHLDEASPGYKQYVAQSSQYFGDQPGTSGPVYVGAFMFLLAIVSLFYVRDRYKWALFAVALIAILLSWGKNFMGFTEFFVNFFPGYGSFRTVTMILVIVELAIPLLVILFLQRLYKNREEIVENIKPFLITSGIVVLLLLGMAVAPGTFTDFLSTAENDNLANMTDPNQLAGYEAYLSDLEAVRISIFKSDVWRSLLITVLGAGAIFGFLRKLYRYEMLGGILIVLLLGDMITVNKRYLGTEEQGKGYVQWQESYKRLYPYAAGDAENQIYAMETQLNPDIIPLVDAAQAEMKEGFDEEMSGTEKQRLLDWLKFRVLNRNTNYRIYEQGNLTSSSYGPYFHKTIGGYHGAKLSRYQDLIENQIGLGNKAVMNMLNMKYVINPVADQRGNIINSQLLQINQEAMGNAWFVKEAKVVENAKEEMDALNSTKAFEMEVFSMTPVFVNGVQTQGKVTLTGTEQVAFWNFAMGPDFQPKIDTADIPMPYQNVQPGDKICYVRDSLGLQWIYDNPADTTIDKIISLETTGLVGFDPRKEAILGKDYGSDLPSTTFTGEGTIEMTSYHPEEMVYKSSSSDPQLAVFSEIHYPIGWTAYVDDQPVNIRRANYVLRAIDLPAGEHTIKFKYELDSYKNAGIIMWISSIVMILLLAFALYTEWKVKDSGEPLLVEGADDRDDEFAAAKAAKSEAEKESDKEEEESDEEEQTEEESDSAE